MQLSDLVVPAKHRLSHEKQQCSACNGHEEWSTTLQLDAAASSEHNHETTMPSWVWEFEHHTWTRAWNTTTNYLESNASHAMDVTNSTHPWHFILMSAAHSIMSTHWKHWCERVSRAFKAWSGTWLVVEREACITQLDSWQANIIMSRQCQHWRERRSTSKKSKRWGRDFRAQRGWTTMKSTNGMHSGSYKHYWKWWSEKYLKWHCNKDVIRVCQSTTKSLFPDATQALVRWTVDLHESNQEIWLAGQEWSVQR